MFMMGAALDQRTEPPRAGLSLMGPSRRGRAFPSWDRAAEGGSPFYDGGAFLLHRTDAQTTEGEQGLGQEEAAVINTRRTDEGSTHIVALHSSGMSSRQWRRLRERLQARQTVWTPELLGPSEASSPAGEAWTLEMALEPLVPLLHHPCHLVGHSYGGLLALLLALRYPHQVRSLTVYDPVAFGVLAVAQDPAGLADLGRVSRDPVFTDDLLGGTEAWWRVFVDFWNGPGAWDRLDAATRERFLRVGRLAYHQVRSLMSEQTSGETYASITCPTLLLTGEHSPVAAQRVVHLLGTFVPRASVLRLEGAGHMGPITHSDAFIDRLEAHLEGEQRGASTSHQALTRSDRGQGPESETTA
jgi:pimeloyl-ACP methyl ester carboxylesterase